jgi:hypothetical protein
MFKRITMAAFSLAVVWLVMTPALYADDWDKATRITVNQPFEVPGTILPAGTYIIRIVDLAAERHVVRITSEDGLKIYATLIGIPDFRLEPTDKTAITFYESEVNRPKPMHNWFYPGRQYGIEFAYPKNRAATIAKVVEEPVLAYTEPEPVFEAPAWTAEEWLEAPLVAVTPEGEEVEIAELVEPYPESTPVAEPELGPEPFEPLPVLPRTATPFPLLALTGLMAAGIASTLRFFRS